MFPRVSFPIANDVDEPSRRRGVSTSRKQDPKPSCPATGQPPHKQCLNLCHVTSCPGGNPEKEIVFCPCTSPSAPALKRLYQTLCLSMARHGQSARSSTCLRSVQDYHTNRLALRLGRRKFHWGSQHSNYISFVI